MISALRKRLKQLRGLSTVPGLIALTFWFFAFVWLGVDRYFPNAFETGWFSFLAVNETTAARVLGTVASASITTLGLVYSIVLVVFTTAAGNIGPRLLQRFTSDRVNQFTAGLFGGTFLFSLTVLYQTTADFVPKISVTITMLLAVLAVLQLIYFVRTASISVTVDEELAAISSQLGRDIDALIASEDPKEFQSKHDTDQDVALRICADGSGYIDEIDSKGLIAFAQKHDLYFQLCHGFGDFVIKGSKIANVYAKDNLSSDDEVTQYVQAAVMLSESRSPVSDVDFSIRLMIEIALRALSPGINDTFTAITCIDRISSALRNPVCHGLREHIRGDGDGIARLHLPGMTLRDLINTAFHPLRRAAAGNVLMTKHILDALGRLYHLGDDDARDILKTHIDLMIESAKQKTLLDADMDFILKQRDEILA
ncbi:hypothetical protein BFP76_02325 [Amylibacter kogurei]|uniref:DUF2254 domain-containing protein n=1 Tax=Paramylibacter kogurei TaxID=1889778 RepID=A0A2G5K4S1_9RHOB|nr:DUF2254 domain-containing protein [Amylibacter kogurei]PIB24099.1 hypothetical protein BFP76_02325 [Amylibacter kogurei]